MVRLSVNRGIPPLYQIAGNLRHCKALGVQPGSGAIYLYQTHDGSWVNLTSIGTLRQVAYDSGDVSPYGDIVYGEIKGRVTCTVSVLVRRAEHHESEESSFKWHKVSHTLFLDEYVNPADAHHMKRGMQMLAKATEAMLLRRVAPACSGLYIRDEMDGGDVTAPKATSARYGQGSKPSASYNERYPAPPAAAPKTGKSKADAMAEKIERTLTKETPHA